MSTVRQPVTIGLIQAATFEKQSDNINITLAKAEQAAADGAQILCTQEMFSTRYFCQSENHDHFALAESIPGPTTEAFQQLAKHREIVIIVSLFEKRCAGVYHNSAAVIDADGSLLGVYRKMHIPDDPLYHEKFYFTPGDLGFRAWSTRFGKLGVLICWDQWYPEAARLTALHGAEIIFYPTAIGWHPSEKGIYGKRQLNSWKTIQCSHAIANGCYVASVNRTGFEALAGGNGIEFWGESFVADSSGEFVASAGVKESVLLCDVDLDKLEVTRTHWPFMRDRRIDAYGSITRRWIDE